MTWALSHLGWTRSYLLAASLGIVLAVALLLVVHDAPGSRATARSGARPSAPSAPAWRPRGRTPAPGSGFWMHFSTQFSATTLGLLWGYPFFVRGRGPQRGDRRPAAHPDGAWR